MQLSADSTMPADKKSLTSSLTAKEKFFHAFKLSKFDVAKLLLLYIVLSPSIGMVVYKHLLFVPFSNAPDMKAIYAKIEASTKSKKIDVTIPSGTQKLNAMLWKKTGASKIFIVNHGNGGDIANRVLLLAPLLYSNGSVLLYDYEGYGKSTGEPSVEAVKQDGLAAYDYVHNVLHYEPENIVLYGESLGSGVATYIAQNRKAAAIVIQSGFSSLSDAAKDRLIWLKLYPSFCFNGVEMDNVAYLHGPHPPLLIMHGDADVVLPIKHAYKSFAGASEPKKFVKFDGSGHNDICLSAAFQPCIAQFMNSLPKN
ncbi:MAG: alpha/beta hydrolase [Cyanobacteria bacterium SZAS LIN-5]|nr:alpha/beta hydrolase [Cyanobacteria bacterium SZAS LIN-5]